MARQEQSGKWLEMELHDEFLELCALSTSGDLTEDEEKHLRAHLSECADCRRALKEFEAAAELGMPLLSSELAGVPTGSSQPGHSDPAESRPFSTLDQYQGRAEENPASDSGNRAFAFAHGESDQLTRVNWNSVWLPFAACVALSAALAVYTYRVGKSHHTEVVLPGSSANPGARAQAIEQQMSDAGYDREVWKAQLAERDRVIGDLRRDIEQQSASLDRMKVAQANLDESIASDEAEKQQVAEDRASLAQKLDAAQASVQKMQAELEAAQQQRSQGESQDGSLQAQIMDLNGQLRDREQTINKQDELLSHDRDIRDLMGARDLYIAEVYDVGRDGATQKPCGRLFYTRGKSLVFYAYDLDEQPGVRKATTFQAWGRRGADMQAALNLGVFFEDSAAKKRWVLKSDDAKTLEQIDAVFVTVEPNGGSHKPSGKPLLFAYLKIDPNHP